MKTFRILLIAIYFYAPSFGDGDNEEENIINQVPLYTGNNVAELLALCKKLKSSDFYTEAGSTKKKCPDMPDCIKHCTEERVMRLRDAQTRVRNYLSDISNFQMIFWQFFLFGIVILLGVYLIIVGHFNWRTLPIIGDKFVNDPTVGYRYGHYKWMGWIIMDSNHPNYYKTMTPDTHEVEYEPQNSDWEDEELEDEEEKLIQPAWSMHDICDMSADPHERLEIYFKRVQMKDQVRKQPKHMQMYKRKKMLKNRQKKK